MFRILVKKQMAEIFRAYLYNAKKNTIRSKGSTIMFFGLFVLIMVGILGGMFSAIAWHLRGMITVGYGWLYFLLMGSMAIMLGAFGSIFNTYSGLYMAKDNDLLLSMPIPINALMASRLMSVFLMGLMYSVTISIPSAIIYMITLPAAREAGVPGIHSMGLSLLGCLVWAILIAVICLVLSCLLGYVVARISRKLKHRNIVTTFVSIFFIVVYYVFYFKASEVIRDLIENAAIYGEKVKDSAYGLYLFGSSATGEVKSIILFTVASILLVAAVWFVLQRSFLKIVTSTGVSQHVKYREKKVKQRGLFSAMLSKEFARFTGSSNYMLNCGLGILVIPAVGIAMLLKGESIATFLTTVFEERSGLMAVFSVGMICLISAMNDMAAPSVALEGKSIWIPQSLPVPALTVLHAKVVLQLILTCIPVLFCSTCACLAFTMTAAEMVMVILLPQLYVWMSALFGLFMGLHSPNLRWTNEIYPIKQSMSVLVALFGGWIFSIAIILIYLLVLDGMAGLPFLAGVTGLLILCIAALEYWLRRKGVHIFETLA